MAKLRRMTEKIPLPIAKRLIESGLREQASMTQHMVLHEALALLIAHLHRSNSVDAYQLTQELEQTFAQPDVAQIAPGAGKQAATLAARIRAAIHEDDEQSVGKPQSS